MNNDAILSVACPRFQVGAPLYKREFRYKAGCRITLAGPNIFELNVGDRIQVNLCVVDYLMEHHWMVLVRHSQTLHPHHPVVL